MTEAQSERRQRFDALFAAYSSDIVAYCGWRAGSASDAQDAVAEVFLAASRRLDELSEGDAGRVWLYATARRVMANQRRSSRRRSALHERLALDAASGTQAQPAEDAEAVLVHETLRCLGPGDREVLLLAEWERLSPAQIAAVAGLPDSDGTRTAAQSSASLPHYLRGISRPRCRRTADSGGLRRRRRLQPAQSSRRLKAAHDERSCEGGALKTSESVQALRRANPRTRAGFAQSVEATAEAVGAQLATAVVDVAMDADARRSRTGRSQARRRARVSLAGVTLATGAAAAVFLTIVSPDGGPGIETAAAAVKKAATLTAASAERSGTAIVRITHNGRAWAGTTIRWNGSDLAVSRDDGLELRVVDGTLYGPDPDGGWLVLGDPASIDSDSGTTPDEYLAAVHEDIGGVTLRRITGGMNGLTTRRLGDGSSVYSGTVAAGLVARESGFKEGQPIRASRSAMWPTTRLRTRPHLSPSP